MIKMEDIVEVKRNDNTFKISWKMTNWCNYRCSYCYMSKSVSETITNTPIEHLLKIANEINNIIEKQANGRNITLHLIGGEVGYFDLIKILDCIKSKKLTQLIIATNFSSDIRYWYKLLRYCNSRNCWLNIIASLHLEQCNTEEFMKKIKIMVNHARIKCVINDNNVEQYKKIFSNLKGVVIQPTLERDKNNTNSEVSKKTKEYIDYLNSKLDKRLIPYYYIITKSGDKIPFYSNIEMINNIEGGGFDPEGFECTAGLDGIRIDVDGSLRRAGCQWCGKKENWLGNLITGEYILPTEPIVCHTTIDHKYFGQRNKFCTAFGNTKMRKKC